MIENPEIRSLVARQSYRSPLDAYQSISWRLQGDSESIERRLRAAEFLEQIAIGLVQSLKGLIEANALAEFRTAIADWSEIRSQTERRGTRSPGTRSQGVASTARAQARPDDRVRESEIIEAAQRRVALTEGSALLQLGGWVAGEVRRNRAREDLHPYLDVLADAVDEQTVLRVLEEFFSSHAFGLLERWHDHEMMAVGQRAWSGDRSEDGLFWAALILLRGVSVNDDLKLTPGSNFAWVRERISSALESVIESESTFWVWLPADVEERKEHLESELDELEQQQSADARNAVALASLDNERVMRFTDDARNEFRDRRILVPLFAEFMRVHREANDDAFHDRARIITQVAPKEWFVNEDIYGLGEDLGGAMAEDQDSILFKDMSGVAKAMTTDDPTSPIERLRGEIGAWINSRGSPPLVIGRDDYRVREGLIQSGHLEGEFDWSRPKVGVLGGASIVLLSLREPEETPEVLLVDPNSVSLVEFVTEATQSGLRTEVSILNEEKASELVEGGFRLRDAPEASDFDTQARLIAERVLVDVRTAFSLKPGVSAVKMQWQHLP